MTHFLFMDDLKIYEESQVELEYTLKVEDELAGAVGMSLGVRKCARLVRYLHREVVCCSTKILQRYLAM